VNLFQLIYRAHKIILIFLAVIVLPIVKANPVRQDSFKNKAHLKWFGKKIQNKRHYRLTIDYKTVQFTDDKVQAMAVNNQIPAPTLYFKEGETAVVSVTNQMDVETSIHWHGILLPNFQDGVPYLTTPPIQPKTTHTFTFDLKHAGTYWYHSHTGLQEQRGIYGAIVIEPKKRKWMYNHNLTLVLSDWTDENPNEVLRSLKRGSEWYAIKKGSIQSLNKIIQAKALIPQLKMWAQRMPGMDISDVYYDAFLINGKPEQHYKQFKGGDTIRLRFINAGASTYFWLSFGGDWPQLISADGNNVRPIKGNRILHAIGETYDFLVTIPKKNSLEIRAMAQDGSGKARVILGTGPLVKAPALPKPRLIEELKKGMHHHKHASPTSKKHSGHHHKKQVQKQVQKQEMSSHHKHLHGSKHHKHLKPAIPTSFNISKTAGRFKPITYEHLKSFNKTSFAKSKNTKELHLNLTGNMWRYVWSINSKVLSESDIIPVKKHQVLRLHLHNKTMMHHPMHLHGHFFRVLNKNGQYSPLKHTVDVPPMQTVILEFEGDEIGDWFFHCHVLYHMKGGMSRIFRTGDSKRDERLTSYPLKKVKNADNQWYIFLEGDVLSTHSDLELILSNTRNAIHIESTYTWWWNQKSNLNYELEVSYERFLSDYFRLYVETTYHKLSKDNKTPHPEFRLGFRYLLPFFVDLDVGMNSKGTMEVNINYELALFPRLEWFVDWTGIGTQSFKQEYWTGFRYIVSKQVSISGEYDNRLGWGGGLHLNF